MPCALAVLTGTLPITSADEAISAPLRPVSRLRSTDPGGVEHPRSSALLRHLAGSLDRRPGWPALA
jgi:hypothetical protein